MAIYLDPDNALYDDLELNRGVKETFFSPGTPFAFLDRFLKPEGTKELGEVLSKWNNGMSPGHQQLSSGNHLTFVFFFSKALYIPPKQSQAFNQGGTFLFGGDKTIFAHYDESTGAHSDIDMVIGLAKKQVEETNKQLQSA